MKAIAIVGMGCRFAGAPDLHAYWRLTVQGRDSFGPIPPDRWPAEVFLDDNKRKADKIFAPRGAFVEDLQTFPALALGLPPRRVEVMDPQQRLSLEVCLQAIEDAGHAPAELPRKTGVFMGLTAYEYKSYLNSRAMAMLMASGHFGAPAEDPDAFARAVERALPPRPFTATGALGNMSAAAVAQELDLHGPAYTVDAACASALVAVSEAVALLRAGLVDAALAGGAYACVMPDHFIAFSRIGAMSAQGRCLPFDERADGFVQGDGAGAVLLKRLDDAVHDGDRVYAVIHGAAFNNDGRGDGPMAPVAAGQAEVLRDAWADAGLDPHRLAYVETHGTGTEVGDASEVQSMREALGDRIERVALGSAKANVGHTMSAAGIAGLIRTALAIHHGVLPPMANFERPEPGLDLADSPFFVPTETTPWASEDRVAGVSSFGFGGTNAHLVLARGPTPAVAEGRPELALLSAPDEETLRDLAGRTAVAVQADPQATVAGVARAWAPRKPLPARLGLVASDRDGLLAQLRAVAAGENPQGAFLGTAEEAPRIAFLYPGQGGQRLGMLADAQTRFPVLADTLAALEAELRDDLPLPLTHLLYPERREEPVSEEQAAAELTDTANCQPVLLAIAVALTRLLERAGVRPQVVTGHSLGEFTAAAVAGVLSPAEAARFVARRGRAMAELPGDHGAMAALMTDAASAEDLLVPGAIIANVNHPRQVVVSGLTDAVAQVRAKAEQAGVRCVPLTVSHGFHGPALEGLDATPLLDGICLADPQLTVASGIDAEPYRDAAHAREVFLRHARSPVIFTRALTQCRDAGADVFLQVGAGGPLASFARGTLRGQTRGVLTLASRDDHDGGHSLLEALAKLWVLGIDVDARAVAGEAPVASVPPAVLPRERYWAISEARQKRLDLAGVSPQPREPAAPAPEPAPATTAPVAPAPEVPTGNLAERVTAVIARVSAYPRQALKPGMTLTDDLGFDSLMVGDLAVALAEAFPGLPDIPQELWIDRPTVSDLVVFVRDAQDGPAATADDDAPLGAWAPRWVPSQRTPLPADPRPAGTALLVADPRHAAVAEPLAEALVAAGHEVVRTGSAEAADAGSADVLVWCAAWDPAPAEPWPDLATPLVAALDRQASHGRTPDLLAVVRDGDPWAAAVRGVARSVAREWDSARVSCMALEDAAAAPTLLDEWASAERTVDVRLAGGERAILGFVPVADTTTTWAPGAGDTVLVTGGTRGIGGKIAGRLAATGARVLVLGRGEPSPEVAALVAAHPGTVVAVRADVTDAGALRDALAPHGPITALVHAAGVLADGALGRVEPKQGRLARAVKVGGWLAALAACGPSLKVALGIGSWAGRFGSRHQAHYAAANALLSALADEAPEGVRAVVAELGPWKGTAMAETLPPQAEAAMRAEGVDFASDTSGLDALWGDLAGRSGAVVHGRDLPATTYAAEVVQTLSVETHPFLADHRIDGVPVWPLAAALDQVARVAALTAPFQVEDLQLFSGVTVREPVRVVTRVRAEHAEVRLGDRDRLAWRARVRPATALPEDVAPTEGGEAPALDLATFYRDVTFHGPSLQGITAIEAVGPHFVRGRVRTTTPDAWVPGTDRTAFTADPLALDSAMQLCGYVAHQRLGRLGTPTGIARYVQLAPLPAGELTAEVTFDDLQGDRFVGTVRLRDADGRLVAVAEGLVAELRDLGASPAPAGPVDPASWPEVQDLVQRLEGVRAQGLRNPYFHVHQGTARDTTTVDGRELVNFSSYNYLGLSGDPRVLADVKEAVERYGTSVSASRVASGERPFHHELEAELAQAQGAEAALVFTAGHATNVTTIGHLMKSEDLVIHDELIHDSALQGIKLSGAARRQFRHDDPEHLERQLRELRGHYRRVMIVVEGVYSMDGDLCALPAYLELKDRYGCLLFVDEAHSFGVVGTTGRGVGEHYGIDGARVDLWMGTLSKSLASCGGWIAGSETLVTYLRYTAPGFVYSAGLTPANGVAALSALRLMQAEPWRVKKLQHNADVFHDALVARGVDVGPAHGESGVAPAITGNSLHALLLSERLGDRGINVQPIVYPAVADYAARLRFFLSSTHSEEQLLRTAEAVATTLAAIRAEHPG